MIYLVIDLFILSGVRFFQESWVGNVFLLCLMSGGVFLLLGAMGTKPTQVFSATLQPILMVPSQTHR